MGWNPKRWSVFETTNGCLEMTGRPIHSSGYPLMKEMKAHRFIWIQCFGEIPAGLVVRHKCDNRICINPEHLELGTRADNVRDAIERGRHTKGSVHGMARINESIAVAIYNAPGPYRSIAQQLGVTYWQVNDIKNRRTWAHATQKVGQ